MQNEEKEGLTIKEIDASNQSQVIDLAWRVFLKFEAPEYCEQGIESFRHALSTPEFINKLRMYGASIDDEIIGMLATRNNGSHIALFFVDEKYHRQGIGRQLFETALKDCPAKEMTVFSSPYAVKVYHALGFTDTDAERIDDGIRYLPMKYCR